GTNPMPPGNSGYLSALYITNWKSTGWCDRPDPRPRRRMKMELFSYLEESDYEQAVFCQDKTSGLKAIIAIHDTTLGPALGGARMWTYATEEEAVIDALRLAKGMTYKNAAAGLNLGGGKTVIIGNPKTDKNEEMFRAFGRYNQGLNGRY